MITGKKEELDKIIQGNRCPLHDNPLQVAWHDKENSYVIRCGAGHYPEEIESLVSITQAKKRGEVDLVPGDMALLPKADLATGEPLSPAQIRFLVQYANRYGLDAYRGHVVFMYGQPYIGLDGYLYHARKEKITYSLWSRPLKPEEKITYMIQEGDHGWTAEVELLESGQVFNGVGIVTRDEMTELSKKDKTKLRSPVVAAHPWQLCQKRAEWQALRRAFPIGETKEE